MLPKEKIMSSNENKRLAWKECIMFIIPIIIGISVSFSGDILKSFIFSLQ